MSLFSGKRLFLIGFLVVLLVAIPLTIYLAQQQQKTQSNASATTILSLTPATQTVNVGDPVPINLTVNPGSNSVISVKVTINYDSTKLATASPGFETEKYTLPDNTQFIPSIFSNSLVYGDGTITVLLNLTNGSPQNRLTTMQTIGLFHLIAKQAAQGTTTSITIDRAGSQVLSSAAGVDQFSDDVLDSVNPASVTVGAGGATPTVTATPAPTSTPTLTPSPTLTPAPTTPPVVNQIPICTGLTVSGASDSATAPVSLTFTANGNDPDGTVSKVSFNFGDGNVQDVTQSGGIGGSSVSVQTTHTYNNGGAFTASAVLTDNNGGLSSSSSCTQSINVTGAAGSATPVPTAIVTLTPAPTLPASGPGQTILLTGVGGAILSVVGVFLLFAL